MGETQEKTPKKTFHESFAEKVIESLENGTAPFIVPWEQGERQLPYNPSSGTVYKGANKLWLAMTAKDMGTSDPRWMTLHQANKEGHRIKKGAKGTFVQYWQWEKKIDEVDEQGKPLLDAKGEQKFHYEKLDKPIMRGSFVFNGSQVEGLDPWDPSIKKPYEWNPEEKAESILEASSARIIHDQSDRAFYNQTKDEIHLPPKGNFPSAARYYGTALHELGHWTGHDSRLDRTFGPFGSETYAREELRAELASWMTSAEIGTPHHPEQHTAYIASWIKVLKEDPFEILRACRDAERSMGYIMNLEHEKSLEKDSALEASVQKEPESTPDLSQKIATEKTFLAVPFTEKDLAKKVGAKWDSENKSWYAPEGTDLTLLKSWIPDKAHTPSPSPMVLNPSVEFAKVLEEYGLDLQGALPQMDGKIYRVRLQEDRAGTSNGAYCGYSDGVPAGWMQNHKTGEKVKWIATGHVLSEEQKALLKQQAAERCVKRLQEQEQQQREVAKWCSNFYEKELHDASSSHPYLMHKGITIEGLKEFKESNLLVIPLINTNGEIRSLQYINESGEKRFQQKGEKLGNFALLGADIIKDEASLAKGEIVLAEGVATGASILQATGKPVAVAFDAGNLESVAKNIRKKFPEAQLTICADSDHKHQHNVGIEKAKKAAQLVGGKVIIPIFTREEVSKGMTDFNDIHKSRGIKEVSHQINSGLKRQKNQGLTR